MDWTTALLKKRGGHEGRRQQQPGDDNLLSFFLLLASDVIGASLGSAIRSYFSAPSRPHLQDAAAERTNRVHSHYYDDLKPAFSGYNSTSTPPSQQLQISTAAAPNFIPQEPTISSIKGLRNKGQTCYANSVFQALASLPPFCKYLQQLERRGSATLGHELYQTIQYVNGHEIDHRSKRRILNSFLASMSSASPIKYGDPCKVLDLVAKHHSQFRSRTGMFAGTSEQQDAHEFFIALMDVLSTEDAGSDENMSSITCNSKPDFVEERISLLDQRYHFSGKIQEDSSDDINSDGKVCQEEKKYEDYLCERKVNRQSGQKVNGDKALTSKYGTTNIARSNAQDDAPLRCPFDGWLGSTIKCNTCHHVRPIRSAPFVAMSLPVHNSACNALENFITMEYGGFDAAERVSDVLCLACAIQKRLGELEDEELMLKGAISSVQRRKRTKQLANQQSDDDIVGLINESERLKARAAALKSIDPDADEESNNDDSNFSIDEYELIGMYGKSCKLQPIRGDAWKATLIMRPPKILCIHIQRRQFDYRSGQMVKIGRHVDFSEVMDLTDFYAFDQQQQQTRRTTTGSRLLYRLMCVIEHRGSAFGGHYVTYRRGNWNDGNNFWVLVSDQCVSSRSWQDVKNCQAYMLFYSAS